MDTKSLQDISEELGLQLETKGSPDGRHALAAGINELISHDFQRLVQILYRADVSEEKLKKLLNENKNVQAGYVIADLLIERHEQKLKSREQFRNSQRDNIIDEEEKW